MTDTRINRTVNTTTSSHRLNPTQRQTNNKQKIKDERRDVDRVVYNQHTDNESRKNSLDQAVQQINEIKTSKPVRPIDPEIIDDIINNPDWKLDITNSDNPELDGNLNNLMAIVRFTLAKIQQTQRTNERVKIDRKQDQVRNNITAKKDTTLYDARILFMKGIAALTLSITQNLPELSNLKDSFKFIIESSQTLSDALRVGCQANSEELERMIGVYNQDIQNLEREFDRSSNKLKSIEDSLSRMSSEMRVYA